MKKLITTLILCCLSVAFLNAQPCPGTPTMTDADGNVYETVKIGTQCWTKSNLRVAPAGATDATSSGASSNTEPYYYVNSAVDAAVFGYYYNWEAAKLACPSGWHLPSDAEWNTLEETVSGSDWHASYATSSGQRGSHASKLSGEGWTSSIGPTGAPCNPSDANHNASGFSAVPAGFRGSEFYHAGKFAYFWSSTEYGSDYAWLRKLCYNYAGVYREHYSRHEGNSVRCLRDPSPAVTTGEVLDITPNSAICGGEVVDWDSTVTARGVCWRTVICPTVSDSHTTNGSGTGSFTSSITGLTPGTTYYVRAYATTSNGTVYGSQKSFRTICPTVNVSISGNNAIYEGQSTTLTASGAESYAWSNGSTTSSITVSPTSTTTYTVTGSYSCGNTGTASVTVTVSPVCLSCPDYDGEMEIYAWYYNYVSDNTGVAYGCRTYKINNVSSQYRYIFETGGAGYANFDTWLELYNDSCNRVAYNDDYSQYGNKSRIVYTPTADGTYYLKVRGYSGAYGNFTLAAKRECATPLTITGDTVIRIGQSTTLTATGSGSYSWSNGSTTNSITVSPDSTTTYYVAANDECGDTAWASVTVTVLPVCRSCPEYDALMNISNSGAWNYKSDSTEIAYGCRIYKINNVSSQYKYTFETGGAGSADFDTKLYLYNDSCNQVAYNDDYTGYGTRSRIVFTPTVSGTYYLKVGGYNNRYGSFTLAARRDDIPVVSTDSVTNIGMETATCGGNITEEGFSAVTARGVCWSTGKTPTIADAHTSDGTGTGAFTSNITGLSSGATYYVRAYATNSKGTAYGEAVSFSTSCSGDQCEFTFVLTDSYGDGWNGNAIQVTDDETGAVLATLTNEDLDGLSGVEEDDYDDEVKETSYPYAETQTIILPLCKGRAINFEWVAGDDASETSYSVYDGNGELVFTGAGGFSEPVSHTVNCCSMELDENYTYIEDFESYTASTTAATGVEPTCWELVQADVAMVAANRPQLYYRSDFAHSGDYSLRLGNRGVYAMPRLAMGIPLNELRLEMYLRQANARYQLEVGVWEEDSTFVPVATFNNSTTDVEHVSCDFTNYTGNGRRIAFRNTLGSGPSIAYSTNYIDDIVPRKVPVNDAKPCPGVPTVTDVDGNVYNTVQIGEQCWMKENMRTTHFADGVEIPLSTYNSSYEAFRYTPNNDPDIVAEYGYLYNQTAAVHGANHSDDNPSGVQGICPAGWHLPSSAEWTQLTDYVGSQTAYGCNGGSTTARALAASMGWTNDESVNNECGLAYNQISNGATGFNALPAGYFYNNSRYFGYKAYFWTTSEFSYYNNNSSRDYYISNNTSNASLSYDYNYYAMSVRCVLGEGGNVPVVTIGKIRAAGDSTMTCEGIVTADGGEDVIARGICWNTWGTPTVSGSHTEEGAGLGSFTGTLTGLTPGTRYYVRAYATNATGTAYSEQTFFVVPKCRPIYYLPYTENFDRYTPSTNPATDVEPNCWELVQADVAMPDARRPQLYYNSDFAHSGSYSLKLNNRGVYAMPELFETIKVREVKLEMYLRQPNAAYQLEVGVWEPNGTFVPVKRFNNNTADVEFVECNFFDYTGAGGRIAFRNVLADGVNYSYSVNYLDDVRLTDACQGITLPYTEDFENYTTSTTAATGVEPLCWNLEVEEVDMPDSKRPQLYYKSDFAHSGNYSLKLYNRGIYSMPYLSWDMEEIMLNQVKLEMYVRQPNAAYQLEVGVWDVEEGFIPVQRINNSTTEIEHVTVDFSGYDGWGSQIAFRNVLADGVNYAYSVNYIDDITLTLMEDCSISLPYSEDFDSYTQSNTAATGVEPDCWELVRTDAASMPDDKRPQIYYKSDFAHSGDYSLKLYNRGVYAMPALDLDEGTSISQVKLEMYLRQANAAYQLQVGVWDGQEFVPVATFNNGTTNVEFVTCDFSGYTGNGNRIAFRNVLGSGSYAYSVNYLDNITLTVMQSCSITPPYTETFEGYTESTTAATGVEPDCWELVRTDAAFMPDDKRPQIYYNSSFANSGDYTLKMGNRCVYAMPELGPNVPVNQISLEMYLRQPNAAYRLEAGVWDGQEFVPVATFNNSTTAVEHVTCDFSGYNGNGNRIAFRNVLGSGKTWDYSYNYIDDITLTLTAAKIAENSSTNLINAIGADRDMVDILVYPNPTHDFINVECTMHNVQCSGVEVIDVYGKVIRTVVGANNDSPTQINVSGLANGMYFVRVTTEEGAVTKPFVKR